MAMYRMRFFFDFWAGHCLWSSNEAALEKYDYPVFLDDLPISDETLKQGKALLDRAGVPEQFLSDARSFLENLRIDLGPDFEIVDEVPCCGSLVPGEKIDRSVLKG